jgi:hypothetical protein
MSFFCYSSSSQPIIFVLGGKACLAEGGCCCLPRETESERAKEEWTEETRANVQYDRADEKTASEYNLEGGATLHLVLALRGGF